MLFLLGFLFTMFCIGMAKGHSNDADEMYSKLFLLPLPSNGPPAAIDENGIEFDPNLMLGTEFISFYMGIEQLFDLANHHAEIVDSNRKKFIDLFGNSPQQREHSLIRNCEIWKFWRSVGDTFDKYELLDVDTKNYVQNRQIFDTKFINCAIIEKALQQIKEVNKTYTNTKKGWAQLYLEDVQFSHYAAIRFLLSPGEKAKTWKFSEFFDTLILPNETNFAFQLRVLHIKKDDHKMLQVKYGIYKLIGDKMAYNLEFDASAYLAPETIGSQIFASRYIQIFMDNVTIVSFVDLSTRIYFERIWQICLNFKRLENVQSNWMGINKFLDEEYEKFFFKQNSLTKCHEFWFKIAKLHNTAIGSLDESEKMPMKNFIYSENVSVIDHEIAEDHCMKIEWLCTTGNNLFSDYIKRANDDDKMRLKQFIRDRLKLGMNGDSPNLEQGTADGEEQQQFERFMAKCPALKQLLQFENESFAIIEQYELLLMRKNIIPMADLASFNTNFHYFNLKEMLTKFIGSIQMVKFGRKDVKLEPNIAQLILENSDKQLKSETEKRIQICYIHSFLKWVMAKDNEKVVDFLLFEGGDALDNDGFWNKPNCEDEKVAEEAFGLLTKCPDIEFKHINQINDFANKNEHFADFLSKKILDFPSSDNSEMDRNFLYQNFFLAADGTEQVFAEINLALKHVMKWIYSKKNELKNLQFADLKKATTETFIMLRIIDIFDNEMPNVRKICIAIPFFKLLISQIKKKRLTWTSTLHCLTADVDSIFSDQREFMRPYHQQFFNAYLPKCNRDDEMMKAIREDLGKLAMLGQLIDPDELYKSFNITSNREKMIDRKLFIDKNHLLIDHYYRVLCAQTVNEERLKNRVLADLFVLMTDYFNDEKWGSEGLIKSVVDWRWLYCRILYEMIIYDQWSDSTKVSYFISTFIPEMHKFLINNKKLANDTKKFRAAWVAMETKAVIETEMQWMESQNVHANPNELVQKMHFQRLNKLKNEQKIVEIFNEIKISPIVRLNMSQLLTKDDAKKLLEEIGAAKFDENELETENSNKAAKNRRKNKKGKNKKKNKGKKEEQLTEEEKREGNVDNEANEIEFDENNNNINNKSNKNNIENEIKKQFLGENLNEIVKEQHNAAEEDNEEQKVTTTTTTTTSTFIEDPKEEGENWIEISKKTNKIPSKKKIEKMDKNSNESVAVVTQQISAKTVDEESDCPKALPLLVLPMKEKDSNNNLTEFCANSTLLEKLKKYFSNFFDERNMAILTLGAFVNEIEHRIKMIAKLNKLKYLNKFLEENKSQKIIEKWEQMKKNELAEVKLKKRNELQKLEKKLYKILLEILLFIDGEGQLIGLNDTKLYLKENLKKQIYLNNISTALIEDKNFRQIWTNLEKEAKTTKMSKIQVCMELVKFDELVAKWEKVFEQIEIDQHSFCAVKDEAAEVFLPPTFPLHSQQLIVSNAVNVLNKWDRNFDHFLTIFLYENIDNEEAFERKRNEVISKITAIVDNWSNKQSRLLISGSLLLGAHTIGSDVNFVCLTPGERLARDAFMGSDKNAKCVQNECITEEPLNASSLFCQICEHKSTNGLLKIESDSILLIRFNFDDIEFDISLIAVPKIESLAPTINDNELKNLLRHFDWSNTEHKNMLRSLSSYRSTLYLLNLFYNETVKNEQIEERKNIEIGRNTFQNLLVILKIWAKNNYIYSNKMGFLNGMVLSIMAAKILLLYPNATLPFLIEKFFLYYSTRPTNVPVQLTKYDTDLPNANIFLLNTKELEMPVLTPIYAVQNSARLVTHPNLKVIRRELFDGLSKINVMKNKEFDLGALLSNSVTFTQKYENFIAINCIAEQADEADAFCAFVEWRMRLQIIFDIDQKGGSIETHLHPNIFYQKNCNLSLQLVQQQQQEAAASFQANYCKVWLLGLINNISISKDLAMLIQQFDNTIKRHFYYFLKYKSPTGNHHLSFDEFFKASKIELKSVLVKKEELIGY